LNIESIESNIVTLENIEEAFEQDELTKKLLKKDRGPEFEMYENFFCRNKKSFMDQYGLDLRTLKIEILYLNKCYYLIDVENITFKNIKITLKR